MEQGKFSRREKGGNLPMRKIIARTGTRTPESGIYKYSGRYTEVALSKDDIVPPNTEGHQQRVILVRPTRGGN